MKTTVMMLAMLTVLSCSTARALTYSGVMDNRTGLPSIPGFTAQSPAWFTDGSPGGGLRLEWQADNETNPGSWTYTYRLVRGIARNKGFAYFDIETASDFTAADIKQRLVVSATDRFGAPIPSGLSAIKISDPVNFNAVHDFSNAALTESDSRTVLDKGDLSHYSGDPGRVATGQPGGRSSATPSVGPVPHPFFGIRVTFPGSFLDLAYEASDWEFKIVTNRFPMWGSFFGWGDQTFIPPFWYSNFYNNNIDNPDRLTLAPADSTTGAAPYQGWILVPGPSSGVISTIPADVATEVPFFEPINAVFNGDMDPTTITAATFTLSGVTGAVSYDQGSRTATLVPDAPLLPSTTYTATLTTGIKDLAGNAMATPKIWSFTTTAQDIVAPAVVTTGPASGATNVPIGGPITATFSETMDQATTTPATFSLTGVSFAAAAPFSVAGSVSYNLANRTATFSPAAPLAMGTIYTATISTGVKDRSNNAMAAAKGWSFTTMPDGILFPGSTAASIRDVLRTLQIAVNLIQPTQDDRNHGDVAPLGPDGKPKPDGQIDIRDAILILHKTVGLVSW